MRYVLDSSAFIRRLFEMVPLDAEMRTVPEVYNEVRSLFRALLFSKRVRVHEPSKESMRAVMKAAAETGDLRRLSATDLRVIAAAKDLRAILLTDDLAMQNVAAYMGIRFEGFRRITHLIIWRRLCEDGRIVKSPDECPGESKMIVWRKKRIRRVFIAKNTGTYGESPL